MVKGLAGESRGYDVIVALHELCASDGARLREEYLVREARRKEAEAELAANPPTSKDIVLHFWKVEPPVVESGTQASSQEEYQTKGGGKRNC